MGLAISKKDPGDSQDKPKGKKNEAQEVKVLLLGSGDTGKRFVVLDHHVCLVTVH